MPAGDVPLPLLGPAHYGTGVRIPIPAAEAGVRLDKLLVQKVPGIGRAGAKRLFSEGRVRIVPAGEGRAPRAAKGDVAAENDVIEIELDTERPAEGAVADPDAPLQIVLETATAIVVDKPAGQP